MAEMENYLVDKNLCIDCNACYTTYPEVFKQVAWEGETKAEAHAPIEQGKLNPWDVIGVCPTDAISKEGEMPEKEEGDDDALPPLEDLGPWEERWAKAQEQGLEDSKWEVMKRYGMAAAVSETKNGYEVKVEFPATTPIHIMKYKMGLPDIMPDYEWGTDLDEATGALTITGKMTDPHIKKLCGKINSLPDRFTRTLRFNHKVEKVREVYRNKVLTVELKKVAATDLN